ncbi:MAG: hypothetical protein ABL867_10360 [Rickettsiales bacterium]
MAKKIIKLQYDRSEHLRSITRKLLVIIEARIELINVAKKDKIVDLKASNELLFGNKLSIAENLVVLAELLAMFGDESADDAGGDPEKNIHDGLSEFDIALVKDFVERQKAEEAKV